MALNLIDTPFAFIKMCLRFLAITLVAGSLVACATVPTDPDERAVYEQTNDPLEPLNRSIFDFNVAVDKYFLTPVAKSYEAILPQLVRDGVRNFLRNLRSPIILANDLLQGNVERAGDTMGRFILNTVGGVGGIFDPAAGAGVEYHDEDFGQTLAVWGFGEGPYLMLPFLGPSSVRDGLGIHVVDRAFDPLNYASYNSETFIVEHNGPIRGITTAIDERSRNYRDVEELENSSLDFYAAVRSLYRQQRNKLISNGDSDTSSNAEINFEMSFDDLDSDDLNESNPVSEIDDAEKVEQISAAPKHFILSFNTVISNDNTTTLIGNSAF